MAAENKNFDSSVGGSEIIPQSINLQKFISSRYDEIQALTKNIEAPSSAVVMATKFPKKLRRRAMSHNVKRIPERLRSFQIEMRERSGAKEGPIRRPRRKYRRRPKNLLDEYNRRQREFVWLETHIWHAKRFRMVKKWGYSLADFPNDKSHRACYRATSQHCLIQDVSYYCCLELRGEMRQLVEGLRQHSSPECGHVWGATHPSSGTVQSCVHFFRGGGYPGGALGQVTYLWQPPSSDNHRTLWLWSHPAFYQDVLEELKKTFSLTPIDNDSLPEPEQEQKVGKNRSKRMKIDKKENYVEMKKLDKRNFPYSKTPKYRCSTNGVTMVLLRDTLNRFRVIGPLAQRVLATAFRLPDPASRTRQDWFLRHYQGDRARIYTRQFEFWKEMTKNTFSPGHLPSNMVIGLTIVDPRFCSKTKISPETNCDNSEVEEGEFGELCLAESPIWSAEVRDEVTSDKLSTQQVCALRSNLLVPGTEVETSCRGLPVLPILLVRLPGNTNPELPLGYGGGWEVICPGGYGMGVWLALSICGGRAGGLKEASCLMRESGLPGTLAPDTPAGHLEAATQSTALTRQHFRLPPAKRPNFIKLGIPSPFCCPWNVLMKDWTGVEEFLVLRARHKLLNLKNKLKNINVKLSFSEDDSMFLVPIRIVLKKRGTLSKNATISLPNEEDIEKIKTGLKNFTGPIEPPHEDDNELARSELRTDHKKKLKQLYRKRKKERQLNQGLSSSTNLVAEQKEVMEDLWVPPCSTVKETSSRTVAGFVSEGDFSFTVAKCCGLGYISLKALLYYFDILEKWNYNKPYVLVRCTTSFQYWLAEIRIIVE